MSSKTFLETGCVATAGASHPGAAGGVTAGTPMGTAPVVDTLHAEVSCQGPAVRATSGVGGGELVRRLAPRGAGASDAGPDRATAIAGGGDIVDASRIGMLARAPASVRVCKVRDGPHENFVNVNSRKVTCHECSFFGEAEKGSAEVIEQQRRLLTLNRDGEGVCEDLRHRWEQPKSFILNPPSDCLRKRQLKRGSQR